MDEKLAKYFSSVRRVWLAGTYGTEKTTSMLLRKAKALGLEGENFGNFEKARINSYEEAKGFYDDVAVDGSLDSSGLLEFTDFCGDLSLDEDETQELLEAFQSADQDTSGSAHDRFEEEVVAAKEKLEEEPVEPPYQYEILDTDLKIVIPKAIDKNRFFKNYGDIARKAFSNFNQNLDNFTSLDQITVNSLVHLARVSAKGPIDLLVERTIELGELSVGEDHYYKHLLEVFSEAEDIGGKCQEIAREINLHIANRKANRGSSGSTMIGFGSLGFMAGVAAISGAGKALGSVSRSISDRKYASSLDKNAIEALQPRLDLLSSLFSEALVNLFNLLTLLSKGDDFGIIENDLRDAEAIIGNLPKIKEAQPRLYQQKLIEIVQRTPWHEQAWSLLMESLPSGSDSQKDLIAVAQKENPESKKVYEKLLKAQLREATTVESDIWRQIADSIEDDDDALLLSDSLIKLQEAWRQKNFDAMLESIKALNPFAKNMTSRLFLDIVSIARASLIGEEKYEMCALAVWWQSGVLEKEKMADIFAFLGDSSLEDKISNTLQCFGRLFDGERKAFLKSICSGKLSEELVSNLREYFLTLRSQERGEYQEAESSYVTLSNLVHEKYFVHWRTFELLNEFKNEKLDENEKLLTGLVELWKLERSIDTKFTKELLSHIDTNDLALIIDSSEKVNRVFKSAKTSFSVIITNDYDEEASILLSQYLGLVNYETAQNWSSAEGTASSIKMSLKGSKEKGHLSLHQATICLALNKSEQLDNYLWDYWLSSFSFDEKELKSLFDILGMKDSSSYGVICQWFSDSLSGVDDFDIKLLKSAVGKEDDLLLRKKFFDKYVKLKSLEKNGNWSEVLNLSKKLAEKKRGSIKDALGLAQLNATIKLEGTDSGLVSAYFDAAIREGRAYEDLTAIWPQIDFASEFSQYLVNKQKEDLNLLKPIMAEVIDTLNNLDFVDTNQVVHSLPERLNEVLEKINQSMKGEEISSAEVLAFYNAPKSVGVVTCEGIYTVDEKYIQRNKLATINEAKESGFVNTYLNLVKTGSKSEIPLNGGTYEPVKVLSQIVGSAASVWRSHFDDDKVIETINKYIKLDDGSWRGLLSPYKTTIGPFIEIGQFSRKERKALAATVQEEQQAPVQKTQEVTSRGEGSVETAVTPQVEEPSNLKQNNVVLTKEMLIDLARQLGFIEKDNYVLFDSDITEKKNGNARAKCQIPDNEPILGMIDTTVFRSAKNSICFTPEKLYWHNDWAVSEGKGANNLQYSKLLSSRFEVYGTEINTPTVPIGTSGSTIKAKDIAQFLIQLRNVIK